MALIPVVRCRPLTVSLPFYTGVLDFSQAEGETHDTLDDPGFVVLTRDGD
jgi:hypothetical protein